MTPEPTPSNDLIAALLEAHGGVMLAQVLAITDDAALSERVLAGFCRDLAQSLPDLRGNLPVDLIAALRERAIGAADQSGFRRVARRRAKGETPVDFSALPETERDLLLDAYRLALSEDELATRLRMTVESATQRLTKAIRSLLSYAGLDAHPLEREVLAAKYVLGLLRGSVRQSVARSRIEDHALAASVDWWQGALAPATRMLTPLPLSTACRKQALGQIPLAPIPGTRSLSAGVSAAKEARAEAQAARLRARGPGLWKSLIFWRSACALCLLLAGGLFGRIWWTELRPRPAPLPAAVAAALALANGQANAPMDPVRLASSLPPTSGGLPPSTPVPAPIPSTPGRQVAVLVDFERLPAWLAVLDPQANRLVLSPIRPQEPASGRVFELWLLDGSGSNPRSLGTLPAVGLTLEKLPDAAEEGAMLAVSLELPGGISAGSAPSLPYLVLGAFVEAGEAR